MKTVLDGIEKLDSKLDRLDARVDNIDVTLARQSQILDEHQRRSIANEKAVDILKEELKPVFSHISLVNFLAKGALVVLSSEAVWLVAKRVLSVMK